jgi:hypothetical protein
MNDEAKRLALVQLLEPYLDPQDCYKPPPLLPLELFFDGNDDKGSIGCNLPNHPGISVFHQTLLALRDDADVSGVWVLAKQHDWKPSWPHSDEILIRTTLDASEIAARLEHLEPDTIDAVTLKHDVARDITGEDADCDPGEQHIVVWWD